MQLANKYNQDSLASTDDKIENIYKLSTELADKYQASTPLTQDEIMQASYYAPFLIDDKGNLDEDVASQIPTRLRIEAMKQASEQKRSMKAKAEYDFKEVD